MELTALKTSIIDSFKGSEEELQKVLRTMDDDRSVFPFNAYHRGNIGNEGQLHIKQDNIARLTPYELIGDDLEQAIRDAAQRN